MNQKNKLRITKIIVIANSIIVFKTLGVIPALLTLLLGVWLISKSTRPGGPLISDEPQSEVGGGGKLTEWKILAWHCSTCHTPNQVKVNWKKHVEKEDANYYCVYCGHSWT